MACAGDVPTLETLAAVEILRECIPDLRIGVINVVDLMTLQSPREHPHGLSDEAFDALLTRDRPIIFAFHGYPMVVLNEVDRFHLASAVIDRVPGLAARAAQVQRFLRGRLADHTHYVRRFGEDVPEIRDWAWGARE
jgi:xylulose-5-phosphate/fructose-6-phosphate phosphoketolase